MRIAPSRLVRAALLLALFAVALPGAAQAWWDDQWPNRMRIVAGGAEQGQPAGETQAVGRTRVLVRLHQGVFNFNTAKEDGSDLRFVAEDDRTPLRFQLERYDSLMDQVALVWVDVPTLTVGGTGTAFYMYWGNRNAPPAADARATFDADTVLAYNFGEDGVTPRDSTANAVHAESTARRDDGLVGFGQRFDGTTSVRIPTSSALAWTAGGPLTISLWFRAEGALGGVLYQAKEAGNAITLGLEAGVPYLEVTTAEGTQRTTPGAAVPAESWRHIAMVASGSSMSLYVDAELRGTLPVQLPAMSGAATVGDFVGGADDPATDGFIGLMDILRVSKAARPPASFTVALRGEGPRADLLRFDVAEEASAFGHGYLGIIARNLTIDAWVVIGILGFIAPITWWLFIAKVLFLNRLQGANRRFRAAWRQSLASAGAAGFAGITDLGTPQAARHFRNSSLFRSYRVALEELLSRGGIQRAGNLSHASLDAIRAAVDSQLTAEGMRLSSGIVILTIAIAGGPFIGLLGTVVGVMITFAAIAAAGDVNVNAIAPGIAAALAATVAGLAVAIPALFAYNYLLGRMKDVNADTRTFSDELITRIGEGATGHTPVGQNGHALAQAAQ
jgi:biopolymer transport protein ExbB